MKRTGIVKAVSKKKKDGVLTGKNAFTLTDAKNSDGTDIWFNGDSFSAEKGDTIEFDVEVNGIWHNFSNVVILDKGGAVSAAQPQIPAPSQPSVPTQNTQSIPETNIAFIDLHGKKYKVTLEESA